MKTIGSIKDLLDLPCEFAMHILLTCPWLAEQWDAEDMGYVFVIDDNDIGKVTSVSESFQHTALSGSQLKATGFTGGYLLAAFLKIL